MVGNYGQPNMNKSELIDAIAADTLLSKADSELALDSMTGHIHDAISRGETVNLFGDNVEEENHTTLTARADNGAELVIPADPEKAKARSESIYYLVVLPCVVVAYWYFLT